MSKVVLIAASKEELRDLIEFSYAGDADLIDLYQAGDRTFEECVDYNYNELISLIEDKQSPGEIYLWKVAIDDGEAIVPVGYCATLENEDKPHMLLSCAIEKDFRNKEVLTGWLAAIEERVGVPYYIGLWDKNTRAIEFFQKNGFTAIQSPVESFKYLVKNPELLDITKLTASWQ